MPIDDRELRRAAAAFVDQIRAERPVLHLLDRTMQRRGDGMKLSYRLEVCVVRRAGRDKVLGVDLMLDRARRQRTERDLHERAAGRLAPAARGRIGA